MSVVIEENLTKLLKQLGRWLKFSALKSINT